MLNTESFIARIKVLMEQYELNASSFAKMIGVQRSSISHILSGRNKPSLEFLAKIEAAFDEVTFEWLLKGEGGKKVTISVPSPTRSKVSPGNESVKIPKKHTKEPLPSHSKENIVKIVHYYADGSFDSFFKR